MEQTEGNFSSMREVAAGRGSRGALPTEVRTRRVQTKEWDPSRLCRINHPEPLQEKKQRRMRAPVREEGLQLPPTIAERHHVASFFQKCHHLFFNRAKSAPQSQLLGPPELAEPHPRLLVLISHRSTHCTSVPVAISSSGSPWVSNTNSSFLRLRSLPHSWLLSEQMNE